MWAVSKPLRETGTFIGAEGLRTAIKNGPKRKRVGLKPEGRQPVRSGTVLLDADSRIVGEVTSGGFGPSAGHPIAMGYVETDLAQIGTQVFADVRGNRILLSVHSLPFTQQRYRKG
jgi:aminomethyltransferase